MAGESSNPAATSSGKSSEKHKNTIGSTLKKVFSIKKKKVVKVKQPATEDTKPDTIPEAPAPDVPAKYV